MANVERLVGGATEPDANVPDSELTREEIIARNMRVVEAHFHNETPETIEKAIALYADTITWEGPTRGVVLKDSRAVLEAYRGIFRTVSLRSAIPLRRFATEQFVFDGQIHHLTVVGEERANLPRPNGTDMSVGLASEFEIDPQFGLRG